MEASAPVPADAAWLDAIGPDCLVLVPHPDDESLGCGGLIALLSQRGTRVTVVLVSDGTGSHPASRAFGPRARRELRVAELRTALAALGVGGSALHTLDLPDGDVPRPGGDGFDAAVARLASIAAGCGARTVLAPWRRDPHPDHRAVAAMADALHTRGAVDRRIAYVVWADERGTDDDRPSRDEAVERVLDVSSVVDRKLRAVAAHVSQHGRVITDDPNGFTLPASMLARAATGTERYLDIR